MKSSQSITPYIVAAVFAITTSISHADSSTQQHGDSHGHTSSTNAHSANNKSGHSMPAKIMGTDQRQHKEMMKNMPHGHGNEASGNHGH